MKDDLVKKFLALQAALLKEKERLEARLAVINRALQNTRPPPIPANVELGQKKMRNKETLKDLIPQITAKGPLTKQEILEALHNRGYRFSTSNPMATLNTILYANKDQFRNQNGHFSAKASKSAGKSRRARKSKKPTKA